MNTKTAVNVQVPVTYDYLKTRFSSYRSPKDKISRLTASGELIRLKKGLYLPVPENGDNAAPPELIANMLFGPSYVSLESALSFYGMIPERVYSVRSVTTKRGRVFETPVGRFDYSKARRDYFSIGIRPVFRESVCFLIAAPEKAICDMIIMTAGLKIQSVKAMREYIEEDMRIDINDIGAIDMSIIDHVFNTGIKKREIGFLKEYIKKGSGLV